MPATFDPNTLTLGVRTGLAISAGRTSISYGPRYAVVRTPQNPTYYLGNLLLYDTAPKRGDLTRRLDDFESAFAAEPQVRHAAFAFNACEGMGASEEFTAAGFTLEDHTVMRAAAVAHFTPPPNIAIRPFAGDEDWAAQLKMQMAARPQVHNERRYRVFKERQIAHHRDIAARIGAWLGAFDGERLAGSCGIFKAGEGSRVFKMSPSIRSTATAESHARSSALRAERLCASGR